MLTLQGGRLSVFNQESESLPSAEGLHLPVPDPDPRTISFGCSALDKVMVVSPAAG